MVLNTNELTCLRSTVSAPTDRRSSPGSGGTDAEAVGYFSHATTRSLNTPCTSLLVFLFGDLDKETLLKLHRIHTAHHLSFLVPKSEAPK